MRSTRQSSKDAATKVNDAVSQSMKKKGKRSLAFHNKQSRKPIEKDLRKRIAIRTIELWEESGFAEPLTRFAVRASRHLAEQYPSEYPLLTGAEDSHRLSAVSP